MREIQLYGDHSVKIDDNSQSLELVFDGKAMLRLELTDRGPVIAIEAPNLGIRTSGHLDLESESMCIKTRGDFVHQVGGNLSQVVAGNHSMDVRDDVHLRAQAIRAHALTGSMDLKANDDLSLAGLRVLHNVPTDEERRQMIAKAETFGELMACPAYDPKAPRRLEFGAPIDRGDWNHGTDE